MVKSVVGAVRHCEVCLASSPYCEECGEKFLEYEIIFCDQKESKHYCATCHFKMILKKS